MRGFFMLLWLRNFVDSLNSLRNISGFQRVLNEIFALLRYYAAYFGVFFTKVSKQRIFSIFRGQAAQLNFEEWTDLMFRN